MFELCSEGWKEWPGCRGDGTVGGWEGNGEGRGKKKGQWVQGVGRQGGLGRMEGEGWQGGPVGLHLRRTKQPRTAPQPEALGGLRSPFWARLSTPRGGVLALL